MADPMTPEQRSRAMKRVKLKNGSLERVVQRELRSLGIRFRCHDQSLPGTPDIVVARHGVAIFVHGCFWHAHSCRHGRISPVTNAEFWCAKRADNRTRDRRKAAALRRGGWRVLTIWGCQTRDKEKLKKRLNGFVAGNPG